MRGRTNPQTSMLAFIDPESRIPANHPLRTIKQFADAALAELSPQFDALYAADGTGAAVDSTRTAAEGEFADEPVLGPQRARLLRGTRL